MDGCEREAALAALDVASVLLSEMVRDIEWAPRLGDPPVKLVDPLLGAVGDDYAVGVIRVLQDLVASLEDGVDPLSSV